MPTFPRTNGVFAHPFPLNTLNIKNNPAYLLVNEDESPGELQNAKQPRPLLKPHTSHFMLSPITPLIIQHSRSHYLTTAPSQLITGAHLAQLEYSVFAGLPQWAHRVVVDSVMLFRL